MKWKLVWLIVASAILVCAPNTRLQIEPHAAEEIEKAKRR
jgi:hypothetical protein